MTTEELIEDVAWMAETGECLTGACRQRERRQARREGAA